MTHHNTRPLLVATFLVAMITPLFAQEEVWRFYNIKDSVVVEAERITQIPTYHSIATKIPVSLLSTPASIGVVTNSLFDSQDGTVLGDALKNVSGINVQSNFGVHDYFLIRGFDSLNNGLVLTDGTAEPEATFYNLYNIERIEVLKGPSAFLYGGNPLSGTVNLVQKKPALANFTSFSTSYGSFSTYRGTLDFNRVDTRNGIAFRLNGLYQGSDNYRDDKDNKTYAVNPALTWQVGERSALTFNFEYARSEYMPDSGLPLQADPLNGFALNEMAGVSRKTSYQSPFDLSDQSLYRTQLIFNSKINDIFTLQNKTYFTDLKWDSRGTLLSGAFPSQMPPFPMEVQRSFLDLDDRQKLFGNQLEGVFTFNTGSVEHSLLTGFEYIRYSDVFSLNVAQLPVMDLANPVETATEPLNFIPDFSSAGDAHSDIFAPYFVNKIAFLDRCTVFLGGRFDIIDYVDEHNAVKRNYEKFSPMFGFGYMPTDGLSLYGNVGRAFAPPSTRVVGDLQPEESVQIEVGAKQRLLNGRLNATLAVYQLEKENIAIPDDNGVTQQNGNQRSRGVELELKVQPSKGLLAFLAYSYTDAELTEFRELIQVGVDQNFFPIYQNFDRSGNRSAFAPKHILNLWFTKELQYGIGIGGGGRYLSNQYIAEDNIFKLDSALLLDAALFYRTDSWKCSLNFKNLTNREYELRGFTTGSVIPASPFAVFTEIEFSM